MKRTIYHGSDHEIQKPVIGLGNRNNDYGLGFYCCSNKGLADELASKKDFMSGVVNEYEIRDDNLKILDLTKPPYDNVLYWVAILTNFRSFSDKLMRDCSRELKYLHDNYYIDVSQFDVVIGYRADDNYFQFPQALLRSEILIESLQEIFALGNLGKQYVLISEKAFSLLRFVKSYDAKYIHEAYRKRKDDADRQYKDIVLRDRYKSGTRMIDLVRDK